jgi:hypothetical protein
MNQWLQSLWRPGIQVGQLGRRPIGRRSRQACLDGGKIAAESGKARQIIVPAGVIASTGYSRQAMLSGIAGGTCRPENKSAQPLG